ncbi:MAG: mechanosensitive ion channel [Desulfovibrionales bacterium]|nr:mechanosensitive ion channel [Desulfovibrionales bacterium]
MKIKILVMVALCAGILFGNHGLAQEDRPVSESVSVLSSFFQTKAKEVGDLQREADALQERLKSQEAGFKAVMDTARDRLQTLDVMARMVKTNPYDMRVALAEATYLHLSLTKDSEPLMALVKEVGAMGVTVGSLQEDLERKWAAGQDRIVREDVQLIRKDVTEVAKKIKELQVSVEKLQAQTTEIQTRTAEWITAFQTQLPLIWKAEFLDAKEFRLLPTRGDDISKDLVDWLTNLKALFSSQYASATQEHGDWIGMLVLFWLPFVFVGFAAYRFLKGVFENAHAGGRLASAFGILWLSLALSLLAAFLAGLVKQTSLLLVATHVLMLMGVQALAWVFRNVRGTLQKKSLQPLLPLVFLSTSVSVLDLLRLPHWLEHLSWVGLVVLSSLFFGMIQPKLRYERLIRRAHPYVMAILVAVAVLGWGNLAILASTLWGVVALALQLGIGATSVVRVLFEKLDKTGFKALVADLAVTFLTLLVWLVVLLGIMAWISINLGTNVVYEKLSTMELNWGDFSFNFLRLGVVILLFQVVRSLAMAWKTVLDSEHLRWKNIDHGAAASLQRIGIYCLWLLYALVSLNLLGISLTSFAVIAGGLSVGIGFGMQTIISNFISGLILLFDRAIQPGDVIEVNGVWAKVMSVNIRNTEVQTFENAKIFLPNSTLIANQVTNWTHRNDVRIRRDVAVGVAYGSDVQLVKQLLLEAVTEHPAVLSAPAPWVIFSNFGVNSLDFIARFWVRHVDLSASAPSEIREAIDAKFRENGIEIPFPQMDLHVRSGEGFVRIKRED